MLLSAVRSLDDAQVVSVSLAEELVEARVPDLQFAAIGQGNQYLLPLVRARMSKSPGRRRKRFVVLPLPIFPPRSVTANWRSPLRPRGSSSISLTRSP